MWQKQLGCIIHDWIDSKWISEAGGVWRHANARTAKGTSFPSLVFAPLQQVDHRGRESDDSEEPDRRGRLVAVLLSRPAVVSRPVRDFIGSNR